METSKESIANY